MLFSLFCSFICLEDYFPDFYAENIDDACDHVLRHLEVFKDFEIIDLCYLDVDNYIRPCAFISVPEKRVITQLKYFRKGSNPLVQIAKS